MEKALLFIVSIYKYRKSKKTMNLVLFTFQYFTQGRSKSLYGSEVRNSLEEFTLWSGHVKINPEFLFNIIYMFRKTKTWNRYHEFKAYEIWKRAKIMIS